MHGNAGHDRLRGLQRPLRHLWLCGQAVHRYGDFTGMTVSRGPVSPYCVRGLHEHERPMCIFTMPSATPRPQPAALPSADMPAPAPAPSAITTPAPTTAPPVAGVTVPAPAPSASSATVSPTAPLTGCYLTPSDASCADFEIPENVIRANITVLCNSMPDMDGCVLDSSCQVCLMKADACWPCDLNRAKSTTHVLACLPLYAGWDRFWVQLRALCYPEQHLPGHAQHDGMPGVQQTLRGCRHHRQAMFFGICDWNHKLICHIRPYLRV